MTLNRLSPPEEKIAVFRRLFRGRTNVYPRRFENTRSGKSGYSPACANEWVRGVCEKPRIKCSDCPHQNWLPVTDEVVRWHLNGTDPAGKPFVIGVYPMLLDETCFFLAADFDGPEWPEDVTAFRDVCRQKGLQPSIECSRSGNGAHAWLFFEEAMPAALARRLGTHLLTETLEQRPGIGLGSYDRLFPNQDTLPRGGFGNLIALPLQKQPRRRGNSLFLKDDLQPWSDQWEFLGSVTVLKRETIESLVAEAERSRRILPVRAYPEEDFALTPWSAPPSRSPGTEPITGPLPDSLDMVLADQIYIPKDSLPPALRNRILHLAAFQNPEFYRAQAMRMPTYDKPRVIACAEEHPAHIALPRGCLDELKSLLKAHRIKSRFPDQREKGIPLEAVFTGTLRMEQQTAAEAILAHDTGVLAATTAFGKTVLAAWLISKRGVNTLILVHRQQLMEQWFERLNQFLEIPAKAIGRMGGGRRKLTGLIDIALIQSLVRKDAVDDRVASYGHLIVDECHHLPARGFELVARRSKAKYITGLSATVIRKDGHQPIIFMQCGPVRHRVDAKSQARERPFSRHVIVRPTHLRTFVTVQDDGRADFREACAQMIQDPRRNAMIRDDVLASLRENRHPLILTERTEHLDVLSANLENCGARLFVLQGGMSKKQLRSVMEQLRDLPDSEPSIVLATGRYIGEGFDDPKLDTLFLAMPVSWRGTLTQYVGRLHRLHEGKREVRVYDYADLNIPMLSRMFDRRCAGYESLGYTILLPASALPGWPADVPLPIDPEWKRDYAASVQRLIRDGVDTPLAKLFVHAAGPHEGPGHARSASEDFIHRRLESLPATRGKFQLNAELPIPFDQRGVMEIDLYCAEAKLAVEIDGPQHLADEEAWRRDRRKDVLLQQHGIFILRFLAGDIGKHLNDVLDSILSLLEKAKQI